jgi:uncharacterized protein YkwD
VSRFAGQLGRSGSCLLGALITAIAAGAVALPGSPGPAAAAAAPCPHATAAPGAATPDEVRRATLCLLNRARRDAPPLVANHDLTRMARRHDLRMLAQDCFQHRCPGEPRLPKRLRRSGYLDGADTWRYAEEIGYETTPAQMIAAWLADDDEAADLLSARYTDVGIGVKSGAPEAGVNGSRFVTYVIDLASRRPAR